MKGPTAVKEGYLGPQPSTLTAKKQYLVLYNLVSLILWISLLLRMAATIFYTSGSALEFLGGSKLTAPSSNIAPIYASSGNFAKWIQTLALLEVVHSLVGLVRAPVMTTAMQVASRLLLVWGVVGMFGNSMLTASSTLLETRGMRNNQLAYFGMLIAWSITECIRYLYFVFFLGSGHVPASLSWLRYATPGHAWYETILTTGLIRYNTFFVLYPLGITCECIMVYKALPFANAWYEPYAWFLMAVLAIYVPGNSFTIICQYGACDTNSF